MELPGIKVSTLPEYQRAKNDLRKYSNALSNRIKKLDKNTK
ncbi:unnamed protein product [marine sediment metagenome]|uniref:Uncharacterized protein n=1 Tax=marine sediment metagenome TaxID=412755 RepID=X1VS62_9ZZZZ